MLRQFGPRLLIALAIALAAGGWALATGAPLAAIAVTLVAGAVGASIVAAALDDAPLRLPPPAEDKPRRAGVRDFIEAFDEPVMLVRDRRIALANSAARDALGPVEGEDVRVAIRHPAATERLLVSADAPASTPGHPETIELVGVGTPDRRWTMTVQRMADGSRLVRMEDRSQVHAAERMRTDFVANASHELRTPLSTLLGFIETLDSTDAGEDGATRRRFLGIMHREAKRIQHLVDDLISLSRIESERFSAPRDAVSMEQVVGQAAANQAFLAEERGSAIELDITVGLPTVPGDERQLVQLFDNLLGNALKYGRAGEPVTMRAAPGDASGGDGGETVRVQVIDRGEGIAKAHLPRITERFYRVDASRSRAIGGTGLGLSIVKHIAERHRGRLTFDSEVGRGTTVTVDLPAQVARPEPARSDPPRPEASQPEAQPGTVSPNRHETVPTEMAAR